MTPNTMRSQLAGFVKLDMGRVRRRTSRKAPNWDVGLHRKGIKCTLPVDRKIKMEVPGYAIGQKVESTLQVSEFPLRNP